MGPVKLLRNPTLNVACAILSFVLAGILMVKGVLGADPAELYYAGAAGWLALGHRWLDGADA